MVIGLTTTKDDRSKRWYGRYKKNLKNFLRSHKFFLSMFTLREYKVLLIWGVQSSGDARLKGDAGAFAQRPRTGLATARWLRRSLCAQAVGVGVTTAAMSGGEAKSPQKDTFYWN